MRVTTILVSSKDYAKALCVDHASSSGFHYATFKYSTMAERPLNW